MRAALHSIYPVRIDLDALDRKHTSREDLLDLVFDDAVAYYEEREAAWAEMDENLPRNIERWIVLQVMDTRWREHLDNMDYFRQGVGLQGYAQKDPLVVYRTEGTLMFEEMNGLIMQEAVRGLMHAEVEVDQAQPVRAAAAARARARVPPRRRPDARGDGGRLRPRRRGRRGVLAADRRAAPARPREDRRPKRSLLVRLREEIQALPWRLTSTTNRARSRSCGQRSRSSEPSFTGFVITFDPAQLEARKTELEQATLAQGFWDDQRKAAKVSAELAAVQRRLETFERLTTEAAELDSLLEMAEADPEWRDRARRDAAPARDRGRPDAGGRALQRRVRRRPGRGRRARRRGRHRQPGLGRDAAAHVPALGRAARLQDRDPRGDPGRGGGPQERRPSRSRARTPTA